MKAKDSIKKFFTELTWKEVLKDLFDLFVWVWTFILWVSVVFHFLKDVGGAGFMELSLLVVFSWYGYLVIKNSRGKYDFKKD
jgi:hypothetical protein